METYEKKSLVMLCILKFFHIKIASSLYVNRKRLGTGPKAVESKTRKNYH